MSSFGGGSSESTWREHYGGLSSHRCRLPSCCQHQASGFIAGFDAGSPIGRQIKGCHPSIIANDSQLLGRIREVRPEWHRYVTVVQQPDGRLGQAWGACRRRRWTSAKGDMGEKICRLKHRSPHVRRSRTTVSARLAARSRPRRHTAVAAAKTQIDDGARSGVRRRGAVDGGTAHGFPIKPFDENRVTPRLHRPASIYTPYPI
jgi:hypothetical protein